MKKILSLVLLAVLAFSLVACGGNNEPNEGGNEGGNAGSAATYTLGMGVVSNANSSETNLAQIDSTVAAVVLDAEGKIVYLRLDAMQNKMDITDGQVEMDRTWQTKRELGDDYNMVKYSDATMEWDAQAVAFEDWAQGKTIDEIKNTPTTVNDHGYTVSADDTLYAGCTIQIVDFVDAVVKAGNDPWAVTFTTDGAFTVGVAVIGSVDAQTKATTADENGEAHMYTEYAAAVVGSDGKVLAALHDMIQPEIYFDMNGEIAGSTVKPTKRELGEDYNMVKYSDAIAEWDAQSKAFTDYCVGKTAAEIAGIETAVNDHGYTVAVDEALLAGCTIQISGAKAVVSKAATIAR